MSWFSCLAVPASFPCCANVNRTSRWAPKNTTSRQPHSWQLLFMALPKWMGISVQTFHHAPAATHKSHWFPANLHLFYSRKPKLGRGRQTDRNGGREKTFIMTQKTSKEEWELCLKRIYETEIEKKKKMATLFRCIFVKSRKWKISISIKWLNFKCLYSQKKTALPPQSLTFQLLCFAWYYKALCFIGLH